MCLAADGGLIFACRQDEATLRKTEPRLIQAHGRPLCKMLPPTLANAHHRAQRHQTHTGIHAVRPLWLTGLAELVGEQVGLDEKRPISTKPSGARLGWMFPAKGLTITILA